MDKGSGKNSLFGTEAVVIVAAVLLIIHWVQLEPEDFLREGLSFLPEYSLETIDNNDEQLPADGAEVHSAGYFLIKNSSSVNADQDNVSAPLFSSLKSWMIETDGRTCYRIPKHMNDLSGRLHLYTWVISLRISTVSRFIPAGICFILFAGLSAFCERKYRFLMERSVLPAAWRSAVLLFTVTAVLFPIMFSGIFFSGQAFIWLVGIFLFLLSISLMFLIICFPEESGHEM